MPFKRPATRAPRKRSISRRSRTIRPRRARTR
jgi:hypothetical protein